MSRNSSARKRCCPVEEAKIWIKKQSDKNVLEKRMVSYFVGWGVFATATLVKGSFLLEYAGDLISAAEAEAREIAYQKKRLGSYLFFFSHEGKSLCVDDTKADNRLGRLVNDSATPNAVMKKLAVDGLPYLCILALKDNKANEEVTYDYGVDDLPWRLQGAAKKRKGSSLNKKKETSNNLKELPGRSKVIE
eukprot:gene19616-21548_t